MWRKVLITLGILCFLSTARAKADDVGYAYCPLGEGYVFLYDSPTSFQVIANLKCGEKLTVVDPRDDNRARVRTVDGKEGYVQKSSLIGALPGSQRQASAPAAAPAAPVVSIPPAPAEVPAQPKPQLQPRPEPQVQAEAEAQPQPESQPQLPVQAQPPVQAPPPSKLPPPAAAAFTPFSTLGYEENTPRLEVFGGYSFMNAGTDGLASRQNVNGFESSVAYNVNRWLAAEGNVGAYYKSITIINVGTFGFNDYLIAGGPRLTVRKMFIHGLIGMDHQANNLYFDGPGPSSGNNVLAAELGGGVQWKVARHIGVRTSADYVLTHFDGWIQSSVRVTAGVVFDLGKL